MRRLHTSIIGLALVGFIGLAHAQSAANSAAPLDCLHGPVSVVYGGVPWLAYACSDGRSVVLTAAPGSPAMPFYFMFSASGSGYRLIGEGTGSRAVTDKAYDELKVLSDERIQQLYAQALSAAPKK